MLTRTTAFLIALVSFQPSAAQTGDVQKQINDQVWKPFIQSYNNDHDEGFKAVHSKDVIRVSQDENILMGYDQYFRTVPDSIKARRANKKKNIELRFIQRIAGNDNAFEVGYYKTINTNLTTGKSFVSYGKFHVLLRKENGTWKILMDADAGDGITEEIFKTGKPVE
jgi:hypothetical protein